MNRQDSLHDQLKTVYDLANKAGCYDAADFIKRHIAETERELDLIADAPISICDGCKCITKTLAGNACGKCGAWKEF